LYGYQQSGDIDSAKVCWEKAATGHRAQQSSWHAAKVLERAAELARETEQYAELESLYIRCTEMYLEEGRPETAAEAAARAGSYLSEVNPDAASQMYAKAIEWLEDSGKDGTSSDTYRQSISYAVVNEKWSEAVRMSLKLAASACANRAYATMSKAYLGAVVILLYAECGEEAWKTYQDALGVNEFISSDQAFAADALISAFHAADNGIGGCVIDEVIRGNSCFRFLDTCIGRLAKKLSTTNIQKVVKGLGPARVHASRTDGHNDDIVLLDDDEVDLT